MPDALADPLPEALLNLHARPLFTLSLEVGQVLLVGETPTTDRRIGIVTGGRFVGERLKGRVLDGGSDWQSARPDGSTLLDVRLHLQAEDGALIVMTYKGLRHGPPEVMERIARGETVDPDSYYFRINPMFETAAPQHDWLNRILAIGIGHRLPSGPVYNLFEVL